MKRLFYPAVFREEEEGGYFINFPDLEGCYTQADTIEEGYERAADVLGMVLEHMEDNKEEIPAASSPKDRELSENEFVVSVEFDMLAYKKSKNKKAVKKTLSIPGWLDELATAQNINFSNVLQEALMEKVKY